LENLPPIPNPSTGQVVIQYQLPVPGPVVLEIFDQTGALVRRLSQESQPSGSHEIRWDGRDGAGRAVPGGVYLLRLAGDGRTVTERVIRIR
jgi:flagellar hook assembly protein FlgD